MAKTGQREGQGLPLCPPRWPPAYLPPGPRWLESGSAVLGPVLLQPRHPHPLCCHPLLQSFLRALGLRPQPLPLPGGPKPSPRRSQSLFSWGSKWLCQAPLWPRPGPALLPAPTPWCWPDTCVCGQSGSCLGIPFSACPLAGGVPRFGGLMSAGDSTSPSTPYPCQPSKFYFCT